MLKRKMSATSVLIVLVLIAAGGLAVNVVKALNTDTDPPSNDMLLTSNRSHLQICVQNVDAKNFDGTAATRSILEVLTRVAQHPKWASSGYSRGNGPKVDVGCPSSPYLLRDGVSFENGKPLGGLLIPRVEYASSYRLFVFVVSRETLTSIIKGDLNVRSAAQEAICRGDACATVTNGIYITNDELGEREFLTEWLVKGLELERPIELGPPDNLQPSSDR